MCSGIGIFKRTILTDIVLRVVENASVPGFLLSPSSCQLELIGKLMLIHLDLVDIAILYGILFSGKLSTDLPATSETTAPNCVASACKQQ